MELSIGFSPCPNDTFIFDALIHQKIDTKGIIFKPYLADVEELNKSADKCLYDITKLSYHAFAYVSNNYILLNSGSALGEGCGPLLISKNILSEKELQESKVAIPGDWTTANFLLSLAYPDIKNKEGVLFSAIETSLLEEKYKAGVIIHENRFTYHDKGLQLIKDLGSWWEEKTQMPIPLGGIAVKRTMEKELALTIQELIRESIIYAKQNPKESIDYIRCNAQEMDDDITQKHIFLYVNKYSIDLGDKGKKAIELMYDMGTKEQVFKHEVKKPYFI